MVSANDIYLVLGMVSGAAVAAFIIWNSSKRFTILEKDNEQMKLHLKNELSRIERQHLADVKALELVVQRQISERKEDIASTTLQQQQVLNNIQKQLDSTKSDIKSVLAKIEVSYVSISTSEKVHDEIKKEIKNQLEFITKWSQRIEDRIENLRKEYLQMFMTFHSK